MNIKPKVSSADRSNLGFTGVAICSLVLDACEFEHRFISCKNLIHLVILGLDFAQDFRVGIDWNRKSQLYLHQDHIPLTYSKPNLSKDIFLPLLATAVVLTKSTNSLKTLGTKNRIAYVIVNPFLCIKNPSLYIIPTVCIFPEKEVRKMLLFIVNFGHDEKKIITGCTLSYLTPA